MWFGILTSCWMMLLSREPELRMCLFQASVPTRAECPDIVRTYMNTNVDGESIEAKIPKCKHICGRNPSGQVTSTRVKGARVVPMQ